MARHTVCKLSDVKEGKVFPATVGKARIVISRDTGGDVKAFSGRCPHQGACLEFGQVTEMVEGDTLNDLTVDKTHHVLRCPWHGFEFSLNTGQAVVENFNGKFLKLRRYDVEIEGDDIVVVT